ncbi:MAG: hypothetical protein KDC35_05565 [Acidobacteria bacterium]|nr:hypothetical protein [Acidobacteriota bacterium]
MSFLFNLKRHLSKGVLLVFCLSGTVLLGQMVAFTGKDSNPPDEFAFVALQDIADGTQIFFTESDYDNTAGTFSTATGGTEGTVMFTVSGTLTTGTVVQISETGVDTFTVTGNPGTATIVGSNSWSATSGDPHYAYSSSTPASPWSDVDEIHAMIFATNAAFGTLDPSMGTFAFPNAIVVNNGFSGVIVAVDFTGDRMNATHASLANSSNFTEGDGDLDLTAFGGVPVELMSVSIE